MLHGLYPPTISKFTLNITKNMTRLIGKLRRPVIEFKLFLHKVYLWIFESCPVSDVIRTKCEIKFEKRYGFISRQIYWGLFRYVTCFFCNLILDKLTAITRKSIFKKCVRFRDSKCKHNKVNKCLDTYYYKSSWTNISSLVIFL